MKNRITWINCAKFIAVLAVVLDHLSQILYNSEKFKMITFFSVTVLIILSGYTTYISYQKLAPRALWTKTGMKLIKLLIAYVVAVFIYQIVMFHKFDLNEYIGHVMKFDLRGPFYFILIYIQLIIISPILIYLEAFSKKQKKPLLWQILFLLAISGVSYYCIKNTYMMPVYGAGQFLFGGTLLLFFYLGIVFASHPIEIKKVSHQIVNAILATVSGCVLGTLFINKGYFLDAYFQTGQKLSPPGITVGLYAFVIYWLIFSICTLFSTKNLVIRIMNYLGECSLYIFLYHELAIIILTKYLPLESYLLKWIIYVPIILLLPVLIKYLIDKTKGSFVQVEEIQKVV